jgi:hypothetical protein
MYIVAQHRIKDPDRFWNPGSPEAGAKAPPEIVGRYASQDRIKAVCVWEADSIDDLRDFIDGLVGDASENTFFEVDQEFAVGLPARAAASV